MNSQDNIKKSAQLIIAILREDLALPMDQRMTHEQRMGYFALMPKRKKQKRPHKPRPKTRPDMNRIYKPPTEGILTDEQIAKIRNVGNDKKPPTAKELQTQVEEQKKNKFLEAIADDVAQNQVPD